MSLKLYFFDLLKKYNKYITLEFIRINVFLLTGKIIVTIANWGIYFYLE